MFLLVVDDEPDFEDLIRQLFRKEVLEESIRLLFARDGVEALSLLIANPDIDLLLTDINMPGMDGLTLLDHLPKVNPLVKAIIVSAYGDMHNIRAAMNRGAFDFITKPIHYEDLLRTVEKTYAQVQQNRATIKAIRENDILKMYVDSDVLRFMTTSGFENQLLQSEATCCTVAFIDICGFTALSENLAPAGVVAFLNTHFDIIVTEIVRQNGHVDKFMGDCVMAVFRENDHEIRAVRSALAIRRLFQSPENEPGKPQKPGIAIGINTGDVVSGNIGSETYRRLDYTIVGDVVNTAKRLQSAAQKGQILVTERVHEAVSKQFTSTALGPFVLRNKVHPVPVFSISGERKE